MFASSRVAWLVPVGLLLISGSACAQLRFGELSTNLSGTLAPGYSATYSNMAGSTHSWVMGGAATVSGSFYNPNFLSYNGSFYLNQSRANSDFQSISNASGVNMTTSIFGGSKFPGSVSYSKAFNSEGNYAVPGLADYVTHGNSDTIGINWSENLPDAPSFSAGFQMGNSGYSVYGTDDTGKNAFRSLNLHSGYRIADFSMGAYYSLGNGHSLIPEVIVGDQIAETHSDNSAFGFNLTHKLPWRGSASASINRSTWDTNYLGTDSNGTIDILNSVATVHPTQKLAFTGTANYSDNLAGQLIESLVPTTQVVAGTDSNSSSSNSLDLMGVLNYSAAKNLQTSAFVERRTQLFFGETYGVSSYGGSATYAHRLLNGTFNSAVTVTANTADKTGQDTLGLSATGNYSDVILGWHLTGSFGYAQNVQTLLITYMNSFYNYSGSARRNWGEFNMSVGGGAARTALSQDAGTANSSESYNASMGYTPWVTATGSYSKSSGQALVTGAGLVPITGPTPGLPTSLFALFGGDSYSFGVSSTPVKRLIVEAAFARSTSNTATGTVTSANQNEQFNGLVQYQFRKTSFTSGFARLEQGFSVSATKPEVVSSYYAGVSRWFNVF